MIFSTGHEGAAVLPNQDRICGKPHIDLYPYSLKSVPSSPPSVINNADTLDEVCYWSRTLIILLRVEIN